MQPIVVNRCIIAGGREINDYNLVELAVIKSGWTIREVISGAAPGVDTLGERWALEHGIPVVSRPAKWWVNGHYNPAAGYQRNAEMGDYADAAICVWDGISGGTKNMIKYMKKLGKPCYVFRVDQYQSWQQNNLFSL